MGSEGINTHSKQQGPEPLAHCRLQLKTTLGNPKSVEITKLKLALMGGKGKLRQFPD